MHLPFSSLQAMIENRLGSLMTLAQSVFMKPIRQMRYTKIYEDPGWTNRLISNNVSELSSKGTWKYKKDYPDELKPSEAILKNSDLAASMGTSLWFSTEEKKKGMPKALFAAGQYNICMNLLEYIAKIEKDSKNTTGNHGLIISCKQQLMKDWTQFQNDPYYLFSKVLKL